MYSYSWNNPLYPYNFYIEDYRFAESCEGTCPEEVRGHSMFLLLESLSYITNVKLIDEVVDEVVEESVAEVVEEAPAEESVVEVVEEAPAEEVVVEEAKEEAPAEESVVEEEEVVEKVKEEEPPKTTRKRARG